MAEEEVGKIEINGTIYPIKDETSRTLTEGMYKATQTRQTVEAFDYTVRNTTEQKIYTMPHPKGMYGTLSVQTYTSTSGNTLTFKINVGGITMYQITGSTAQAKRTVTIYANEDTPVEIYAYKTGSANQRITISAEYLQLNPNA